MVLLIKKQTDLDNDLLLIAKMMINIEHNKTIYKLNGSLSNENIIKKPFNSYTHQQIDFDINVSSGIILLYILVPRRDTEYNVSNIQQKLIGYLSQIESDYDSNIKIPYKMQKYNNTTYTLLSKKYNSTKSTTGTGLNYGTNFSPSYRKIVANKHDFKKCVEYGSRFVWLIQINNEKYLTTPELNDRPLSNQYLSRSISTIIYDNQNIFDMKHGTKQLDYPNIYQYTKTKNNQLLNEKIVISNITGLDYEILSYYQPDIYSKYIIKELDGMEFKSYHDYEIRRKDNNKDWLNQIFEPFNYEDQELIELNIDENGKPSFPKDVCFISGMPLYNNAYILEIHHFPKNEFKEEDEKYNTSFILVTPFIYYNEIFRHNLFKESAHGRIKISKVYITNIERTEFEAINLISEKKISPLKREILYTISKYGIMKSNDLYNTSMYSINPELNKIYIGRNNIYDTDILEFNNPNVVLFHYSSALEFS